MCWRCRCTVCVQLDQTSPTCITCLIAVMPEFHLVKTVITHTHARLTALFRDYPGELVPERKPIWILLKQETVSGIGISWAICKSATRSRQITMPAPHRPVFYRPDALPADQPTASKHWRGTVKTVINEKLKNETDNSARERNGLIPRVSLL